MELPPMTGGGDAPFEWNEFFDFTLDDPIFASLTVDPHPHPPPPPPPPPPAAEEADPASGDRVRKRDPRMICENFLAGLVPCACPELDAMIKAEEEEVGPGKKRARVGRTPGLARCQVPGCEVDISQLKGYHRRHRVCLACANAVSVSIDGETKRYCQQCGKFHLLPDFDEGKRSCRRKLERHNNRRRRKPADSRAAVEKDIQGDWQTEDVSSDSDVCKDKTWESSQLAEREDSKDGTLSNLCSALESQNVDIESTMTFTQVEKVLDNAKKTSSPPSDNKSAYSSACPTGRISFKLYDWNPAEFPRRLRHQIFQWLSNMPVELEGYIRPGCTILTAFVSMPQCMWAKLFEDPASYIQSSVGPGGILFGKGAASVYLNDVTYRILRDGTSVMKLEVAVRAPKLHYVYPPCFEAGKPMDLIACGSNLLQSKFRSLISFAGEYLAHDYYVAFSHGKDNHESSEDFGRQSCRIYVPSTKPSFFGPAFIEVENECGISNFIPVLIGDEHVCAEINMIHQKYDFCCCVKKSQLTDVDFSRGACEASCSSHTAFSEFMLDVAWLLKCPSSEKLQHVLTSCQVRRFSCVLNILTSSKSGFILERILRSLVFVLDEIESSNVHTITDFDKRMLNKSFNHAKDFLSQNLCKDDLLMRRVKDLIPKGDGVGTDDDSLFNYDSSQALEKESEIKPRFFQSSDCLRKGVSDALLDREACMNGNGNGEWPKRLGYLMTSKRVTITRPLVYMIAAVAVCFGVCAVAFHPQKVAKFAVTIRSCVFDQSSN
ncbi:hypothetical protein RND81_05G156900 [Saponaria officinalis]|uniref:SBP-type domain-containing protein n=1 Tax=Saponaria officinalis TaxID=3572 RepID=A0AAW1KXK7_SAPOF